MSRVCHKKPKGLKCVKPKCDCPVIEYAAPFPIEDSDDKDDFTEGRDYSTKLKEVTEIQYKISIDKGEPFLKRVGHFLLGTSNAGRWGKVIKDFALFFVPYGKQVGNITDFVTDQFENNMAQTKSTKPKLLITNIVIGIASGLVLTGVIPADTISLDASAAWVGLAVTAGNAIWNYFDSKETK